jgi:hypothetical protein
MKRIAPAILLATLLAAQAGKDWQSVFPVTRNSSA